MSTSPGPANAVHVDDRDESDAVTACAVVLAAIATMTVGLRFYVRARLLRAVKSEDWCMLVSMVFAIIATSFLVLEAQVGGLGRPIMTISAAEMMAFRKWAYFQGVFHYLSLGLTKISILLLYLRVLTHDYIRKVTWAAIALVALLNAWNVAMQLTMCIPLQSAWDDSVPATFKQGDTVFWVLIYMHIATDFMIFLIPIPVVLTMTIPKRQKIGLLFVFTTGLFVCLVSVVRSVLLNRLLHTADPSWDLVSIANWSSAELDVAIVCGCMPTLRPVLAKAFGPLMDRFFPEPHQSLTEVNEEQPRTIGSMPLKAFRFGRHSKHQGSGAAQPAPSWAEGETLSMDNLETSRQEVHSKGMDSDAELIADRSDAVADSRDRFRAPPRVYARG